MLPASGVSRRYILPFVEWLTTLSSIVAATLNMRGITRYGAVIVGDVATAPILFTSLRHHCFVIIMPPTRTAISHSHGNTR